MSALYHALIYDPLLNTLVFLYQTVAFEDLGVAIVILTVVIRLILFPLFHKSMKYQMIMQEIQPKIKKAQEDHKHDLEKQSHAMMAIYKEHKVNPFSGFLFLLIQLPILIALYQIFLNSLHAGGLADLYSFVVPPETLNKTLLGLINLEKRSIVMVVLAAAAQYAQGFLGLRKNEGRELSAPEKMNRNMMFIAPLLTVVIFLNVPSAVGLYWFTTTVFSIVQQLIVNRQIQNGKLGTLYKKTD